MKYGIHWVNGDIEWENDGVDHTRETALASMEEAGHVEDNCDQDCLVWETASESVNDDGSNAIGRLIYRD